MFKSESLQALRERVDIVDVLSSHIELQRAGASYKALCPFHDEKTPSFVVQKGDSHYHCFGCGEHGDAIQFLMTYLKMGFVEAVESLAERFHVALERTEGEEKGPSKTRMKEALSEAKRFYHFVLLNTPEGKEALNYLHARGLTLDFIKRFELGWAPSQKGEFAAYMKKKGFKPDILDHAGLIRKGREFFNERVLFPICNPSGAVIGFSGRKIKESTFGGKYINSPETPLFRKSRILFGLHHCRRRIAKERQAIIVEGQIDALRLIDAGLDVTVAGQGTAFGEGQVQELLRLGVRKVTLALDSDQAGRDAAAKIGDLFCREGVEVKVANLPQDSDPDTILKDQGFDALIALLKASQDYLPFLVEHSSFDTSTPAGKNALIKQLSTQIRAWNDPVMVHESLRTLASLTRVPENILGIEAPRRNPIYTKRTVGNVTVDPNQVLEADVLRWLLMMQDEAFHALAKNNLKPSNFHLPAYQKIFEAYLDGGAPDLLSLATLIDNEEMLAPILHRKINRDRAKEQLPQAILKLLERNWMEEREAVLQNMQAATGDEAINLAKEFDKLKCNPPKINN